MRPTVVRTTLILLIVLMGSTMTGCFRLYSCNDSVFVEESSPDKKYVAVAYQRNCGATTGFATRVTIQSRRSKIGDSEYVFGVEDKRQVKLVWTDARKLNVECVGCTHNDIFRQETFWKDVSVTY